MNFKRILVTGGAGFIGSHLVEKLASIGYQVLVIDNFLTGNRNNLTQNKKIKIVEGTITNLEFVDSIFKNFSPSIIVHAAASFHDPFDHSRDINTNTIGTINIIEASKKYAVEKIIYYQTSLCYGTYGSDIPISPTSPYLAGTYKAGSSYAISKIAAELYLEMSGINFISFRLANVYGPRNFSGPLPVFFHNIYKNIESKIINSSRDFIFVDDVISCTIKAIESSCLNGYFNIGTEIQTKIIDLFKLISETMAIEYELSHNLTLTKLGKDDTKTIFIDSQSTRKVFNWEPVVNLKDGVNYTIDWYKINGVSKTFTHLKNIIN